MAFLAEDFDGESPNEFSLIVIVTYLAMVMKLSERNFGSFKMSLYNRDFVVNQPELAKDREVVGMNWSP